MLFLLLRDQRDVRACSVLLLSVLWGREVLLDWDEVKGEQPCLDLAAPQTALH